MLFSDLRHVPARAHGGTRTQTQMVVVHITANTASDEGEAAYAQRRTDASATFYSDHDSVIQALDTDLIAYGCYPTGNARSVQFEITAPADRSVTDAALRAVAPVIARVCKLYGLPLSKITAEQLRAGWRGICGHADVTSAWGEGNHQDGGPHFPWQTLIRYVQAAAGAPVPVPSPAAPTAPPFPLPRGHVYGPRSGPAWMHGGYRDADKAAVRAIQSALAHKGFSVGTIDGDYGPKTAAAVTSYQRARGLVADGLVGPITWGYLMA